MSLYEKKSKMTKFLWATSKRVFTGDYERLKSAPVSLNVAVGHQI